MAPVTITVERGRVRFFAQVLGVTDPVHHDVKAARAARYPDLLAPPSFLMVAEALAEEERRLTGQPSWYDFLRCDTRVLLHGSESYIYRGPAFAGDDLVFETEVLGFEDKKGGALELCQLALRVSHKERGALVEGRRTLIHRLG
jgi:acyl dehydratase